METRERVAHLLRRFGLGASQSELDSYSRLGVDGAINKLIHYEGITEDFNVSPWSFAFDTSKNKISTDTSRFVSWWAMKMLLTNRPLQENLALFWHNHFAVSSQKVENGPMMLQYLQTLRQNASGSFRTLLTAIFQDPAMIKWLDSDTNVKGKPNENFAREVMELFTLGVGHYSEKDVQEAARAFTGWAYRNALQNPGKIPYTQLVADNISAERPMVVSTYSPMLHDTGSKTILGKRANYDAEGVFDLLLDQPQHAVFLMKKMWEWFAYPDPELAVIERLAKVYRENNYGIKPVLHAIATSNEFWSDRCVRSVVKSPVSYTVAIARQLEVGPVLVKAGNANPSQTEPVANAIRDSGNFLASLMARQGLGLLYPPDVSGWRWGKNWITTAGMIERARTGEYFFRQRQALVVPNLLQQWKERYSLKTPEQLVSALTEWFDAPLEPEQRAVLAQACEANGGVKALEKPATAAAMLAKVFKLVAAAPEFQMC